MATGAISGAGTTLSHATTIGGSYTVVGELIDINFPEGMLEFVDATHYTSASSTKEFILIPWKEWSDVEFEINYVSAEAVILNGLLATALFWKITLSDGKVYGFPGVLRKMGGAIPNQNKVTQKGAIKITGVCTLT